MSLYINLAEQIFKSNNQHAFSQMQTALSDPNTLYEILKDIQHSEVLLFVFTQIFRKKILDGQFCLINQTKSDDNNKKENINQKARLYRDIIPRIYEVTINHQWPKEKQYILKSSLSLIAVCLKDLCDNPKQLPDFLYILQNTLFPVFVINQKFTNNLNNDLIFLGPQIALVNHFRSNTLARQKYERSAKILIELIQYITMPTVFRTYYQYRRNVYMFRNSFLAPCLNIVVDYFKLLYMHWKQNQMDQSIISSFLVVIGLMQKVITYPFNLTLHEFQSQGDEQNQITGKYNQIYFPAFFRNMLCDLDCLAMIYEFYLFILNQTNNFKNVGDTLNQIIRIIGRIISASPYTFNNDQQRKQFRTNATKMINALMGDFQFYDSFYLNTICDIISKVLNSYTSNDLQYQRTNFYQSILSFCSKLIENSQIKLEDGKYNPFNRVFQLLAMLLTQIKQTEFQQGIKNQCQYILDKGFSRLFGWEEAEKIMKVFGKNQKSQIQCFQELFHHIPTIFSINIDKNLQSLKHLQIQKLPQASQIIWLHLCAILLPNHQANEQQTQLILKFFRIAKQGNSIACLHYLHVLVSQILFQVQNGHPNTSLWRCISDLEKVSFRDFMLYVIQVCKRNFTHNNIQLLDYALEIFKSIYSQLKKNDDTNFQEFYNEVKSLIQGLESTIFAHPKLYKKRVQLFSVISTIWITQDNYNYLYQIYRIVSQPLKSQPNLQNLQKFMYDLRGLLQPIVSAQTYRILCEMAISDLQDFLPNLLSPPKLQQAFNDSDFLKAFCKLIKQFTSDRSRRLTYYVQTDLPFQIWQLFHDYLFQTSKYDYPKCLFDCWVKFNQLNPIDLLLPFLQKPSQETENNDYSAMVRYYFQNIHRLSVDQLERLYKHVEDKVQYLVKWWQEIMSRNLKPKVSIKQVVESRIASTRRQKEELAKLLYYVGRYSAQYWDMTGFDTPGQFIEWFSTNYKDFKDN